MSNVQDALSSLLNQVATLVKKMTDEELKELIAGEIVIDLVRKKDSKKGPYNRNKKPLIEEGVIETLVSQLRMIDDREKGLALLNDFCSTKPSLEQVARQIDIPISQQDNMETLREKIIEATIGYRLRSMAIQGKSNLSNSSNKDSIEVKTS